MQELKWKWIYWGGFPKRINVGMRMKTGEVKERWVAIRYDYTLKYCKNCKIQGHNKKECFILHPEYILKKKKKKKIKINKRDMIRKRERRIRWMK